MLYGTEARLHSNSGPEQPGILRQRLKAACRSFCPCTPFWSSSISKCGPSGAASRPPYGSGVHQRLSTALKPVVGQHAAIRHARGDDDRDALHNASLMAANIGGFSVSQPSPSTTILSPRARWQPEEGYRPPAVHGHDLNEGIVSALIGYVLPAERARAKTNSVEVHLAEESVIL